MVMASFLFMQRITEIQIANIKTITNPNEIDDKSTHEIALSKQEAEIMQQADGKIMLFHMSGPMSFSSAKAIVRRHASIVGYSIMLLDLSDVPCIDFTTSRALDDIIIDTVSAGRHIFLVGACEDVRTMLEQQGIVDHFESGKMYQHRLDALLHAKSLL
jgi:SulP family sulfate permease